MIALQYLRLDPETEKGISGKSGEIEIKPVIQLKVL